MKPPFPMCFDSIHRHGAIHHHGQPLRPASLPVLGLAVVRLPQRDASAAGSTGSAGSGGEVGRQLDVFVEPTQGTQAWDAGSWESLTGHFCNARKDKYG